MFPSYKYPTSPTMPAYGGGYPTTGSGLPTKFDYYGTAANWPPYPTLPQMMSPTFATTTPQPTWYPQTWTMPTPSWTTPSSSPTMFPSYPSFTGGDYWKTPSFGGITRSFHPSTCPMNVYTAELNFFPNRPMSYLENHSMANPVCWDAAGNRWFSVFFDMRGFRPDEICLTSDAKGHCLCIEACCECNEENNYAVKRNYKRNYYFPEEQFKVDFSKCDFKSWLSNDGILCVEAKLPKFSFEEARSWAPGQWPMQAAGPVVNVTAYPVNVKSSGEGAMKPGEKREQQPQPPKRS